MIRLLVVDDHLLLREGIKCILGTYENLQIIAEASDGEDALRILKTNKVDILLVDINMPKLNGIELIRRVKSMKKDIRCIVLTAYADEKYVTEAIKAGAKGYVLKSASSDVIVEAIKNVENGGYYFHREMPKRLQRIAQNTVASMAVTLEPMRFPARKPKDRLTLREIELMSLIGQGLRNRDIAEKLFLSEKTVKNHLTNIFRKLGVADRTQALCVAVQKKIVILQ